MRKIYLLASLLLCMSCVHKADKKYYAGSIHEFTLPKDTVFLSGEKIALDKYVGCYVEAYDSLLIFQNFGQTSHTFEVYNAFTQKSIGSFLPKGHGSGETPYVASIYHIYKENGEVKTILFGAVESKIYIWNISRSLKEGKTVIEKSFKYEWRDETPGGYLDLVKTGEDTFVAYVPGVRVNNADIRLPHLQERTLSDNRLVKKIDMFKEVPSDAIKRKYLTEFLFDSYSCVSRDAKKIVQVMAYMGQIDFIDIETGEIDGHRIKGTYNFSIFDTEMDDVSHYYHRVKTNDKHVFALWCGKRLDEVKKFSFNILHVFDMNGKCKKIVKLDSSVSDITIDPVHNILYGIDEEDIYCYRLEETGL